MADKKTERLKYLLAVTFWGAVWGIFEATIGYLLHLLPVSIGWAVWYPAACFFMANVYRKTRDEGAIVLTGTLASSIKLLNLLLPVRIDRVINPAISILFEALAMAAIIFIVKKLKKRTFTVIAFSVLGMNILWRTLYGLYLLLLAPAWIRDISVISDAELFIDFFAQQMLSTSAILIVGAASRTQIFRPVRALEKKLALILPKNYGISLLIKASCVTVLLALSIFLQFILI